VQRLITVGLGDGNEVLEAPVHRLVQRMHGTQRHVAAHGTVDHHTEAVHVHQLGEGLVLVAHLRIDAPGGFDPPDHVGRDMVLVQALRQRQLDLAHGLATIAQRRPDALADDAVAIGMKPLETQLLQLGLELVHAQSLRDRRVDLQRLAGNPATRRRVFGTQRAHVVQSVGQLDQDHAQVARHRQKHLAEALRISFLAAAEAHLVQLGDTIDQLGHGLAERTSQLVAAELGVLQRVVQDRCNDRLGIQPQLGQDARHRHRMGDVGLAAFTRLSGMRLRPDVEGRDDPLDVVRREIVDALLERQHVRRQIARADRLGRPAGWHGDALPAQTNTPARQYGARPATALSSR